MSPKKIIVFLITSFVLVFIITLITNYYDPGIPNSFSTIPNTNTGNNTLTPAGYTLKEISTHSSASSCWSAIQNNVYDLTSWINKHPGGPNRILSICGKDGTSAFMGQHAGQSRPQNELAGFLIGILK